MGFSNYIIIPKLELKIEVSRHFDEDEELSENIDRLQKSLEELGEDNSLHKTFGDLTLIDMNNILNCANAADNIDFECFDVAGLVLFLNSYGIPFEIIGETNEEELNKYNDYKSIRIKYE